MNKFRLLHTVTKIAMGLSAKPPLGIFPYFYRVLKWITLTVSLFAFVTATTAKATANPGPGKRSAVTFVKAISPEISDHKSTGIAGSHTFAAGQCQNYSDRYYVLPIVAFRNVLLEAGFFSYQYLLTSHLIIKTRLQHLYPSHYFW